MLFCAPKPLEKPWELHICSLPDMKLCATYPFKTQTEIFLLAKPNDNEFIISSVEDNGKGRLEWVELKDLFPKNPVIISHCTTEIPTKGLAAIAWGSHTNNLVTYQYQNRQNIFQTWHLVTTTFPLGYKRYSFQHVHAFELSGSSVSNDDNLNHSYQLKFISNAPYFVTYSETMATVWRLDHDHKLAQSVCFNEDAHSYRRIKAKLTIANSGRMISDSGKHIRFSDVESFYPDERLKKILAEVLHSTFSAPIRNMIFEYGRMFPHKADTFINVKNVTNTSLPILKK